PQHGGNRRSRKGESIGLLLPRFEPGQQIGFVLAFFSCRAISPLCIHWPLTTGHWLLCSGVFLSGFLLGCDLDYGWKYCAAVVWHADRCEYELVNDYEAHAGHA